MPRKASSAAGGSLGPTGQLLLTALALAGLAAGFEIQAFFSLPSSWENLLAPSGALTILAWMILLAAGLAALTVGLFFPMRLAALAAPLPLRTWTRLLAQAALLLSVVWFYLYSPWQAAWPGPWTQLVFSACLAQLITLCGATRREMSFGAREIALTLALFLYPRIVLELRALFDIPLVYRAATVGGVLVLFGLSALLLTGAGRGPRAWLLEIRGRLGWLRLALLSLSLGAPLLFRYLAGVPFYILAPNVRFFFALIGWCAAAYLLERGKTQIASIQTLAVSALALILASSLTSSLLLVVNDPFSLSWSEGNRFYDYSLVFGQGLYQHDGVIVNPYNFPGRYVLWGVLFLWPGLPIWVHRLWNIVLQTVPPLLFGAVVTRGLRDVWLRLGLMLWVAAFFIVQAPVHPPLMLLAAFLMFFLPRKSAGARIVSLLIASAYAAISRWTWIPAVAAWGVLTDLIFFYPLRNDRLMKRILPAVPLVMAGLLPGLLLAIPTTFSPSSEVPTFSQPLLWGRLLPNQTYPLGILLGTLLATGPLLTLLGWFMYSGRWRLDRVQIIAIWGALAGFYAAGLIISAKIGGGGDLHNMDLYLVTLAILLVLCVRAVAAEGKWNPAAWPFVPRAMLVILFLLPANRFSPLNPAAAQDPALLLPGKSNAEAVLTTIQEQVASASQTGEVLFMDQRQLLTFGYVRGVPFVPEYEKKYMMDQALADNSQYFQPYYRDLAGRRFSLILTEPLHLRLRVETGGVFWEENDAWVKWVSQPTLCFYEPVATYLQAGVQLLVPRQSPVGCDVYLSKESQP